VLALLALLALRLLCWVQPRQQQQAAWQQGLRVAAAAGAAAEGRLLASALGHGHFDHPRPHH
jgi:hypothetical protein